MKNLECSGVALLTFALGIFVGMCLMAVVTPRVLRNILGVDQGFEKTFKAENVRIGISIDEDIPEIKEITEDLTEEFTNVLAGTIIICKEEKDIEYLKIISQGIVYSMTMSTNKLLEKYSKTPKDSKNPKKSF